MPPPSESASVRSSATSTGWPAAKLATIAAPRSMVMPTMRVLGLERLDGQRHARDQPAARERHQQRRRAPARPRRSRGRACPGRRSPPSWSKGGISAMPSSRTSRSTSTWASSWLLPTMRTSAPSAWMARTLLSGTSFDRQMTARDARRLRRMGDGAAVIAGGGGDDAGVPFRLAERQHRIGRAAQLEAAGRLLMFAFDETGTPARRVSPSAARSGVCSTLPAMRFRASSTRENGIMPQAPPRRGPPRPQARPYPPLADIAQHYGCAGTVDLSNLPSADSRSSCRGDQKQTYSPSTPIALSATLEAQE